MTVDEIDQACAALDAAVHSEDAEATIKNGLTLLRGFLVNVSNIARSLERIATVAEHRL